jgi:hypothetical protein
VVQPSTFFGHPKRKRACLHVGVFVLLLKKTQQPLHNNDGVSGVSGARGASGVNGVSGVSGASGVSGVNGKAGHTTNKKKHQTSNKKIYLSQRRKQRKKESQYMYVCAQPTSQTIPGLLLPGRRGRSLNVECAACGRWS